VTKADNPEQEPTSKRSGKNHNGSDRNEGYVLPRPAELVPAAGLMPTVPATSSVGNPLDPMGLLRALKRRWLLATGLGLVFAAFGSGVMWALLKYVMPPKFTAYALLGVSAGPRKVMFQTSETDTGTYSSLNAHALLIRSPFVLSTALAQPDIGSLSSVRKEKDPTAWLERNIQVTFPAQGEVLKIAMSGENPEDLAAIVNAVRTAYMEEVGNSETTRRIKRLRQLENFRNDMADTIKHKKTLLKDMASAIGSGDPKTLNMKQTLAVQMHAQLQSELIRIESVLRAKNIEAVADKQLNPEEEDATSDTGDISEALIDRFVDSDPAVRMLIGDKARQQSIVAGRELVLKGKDQPALVQERKKLDTIQKSIDDLRADIRPKIVEDLKKQTEQAKHEANSKAQREIAMLNQQAKSLKEDWETWSAKVEEIGKSSFDIEQIRSDIDDIDKMTTTISGEIAKLTIELQAPARISDLQKAEVPKQVDVALRNRKIQMAAIAGFGLGIFVISFWEFRSRRIESPQDVEQSLGLRIMGMLPDLPSRALAGADDSVKKSFWMSMLGESIDGIRTTVLYDAHQRSLRCLMVTSAVGHEGKTTLATHLATSLARAGRRTILVDCDLRRPAVHMLFDLDLQPGFAEVSNEEEQLSAAIRTTHVPDLYILPAGAMQYSVAEGLTNGHVAEMLERLKEEFEFVIIDSAPILPVTDSLIIGQHVDGVILSVLRGASQMHRVTAAHSRLSMLGIEVIGAVVNRARGDVYGYGNYYHYQSPVSRHQTTESGV
jgi:succinoglycan biosynthesis transport protein ExoP